MKPLFPLRYKFEGFDSIWYNIEAKGGDNMKHLLLVLPAAFLLLFISAPAHSVTVPSQCSGMTFDKTIIGSSWGQVLKGTSGRDLIIGQGGSIIKGMGGKDCLVSGGQSIVYGGDGDDVIVSTFWGDSLKGENGNDKIYGDGGSSVNGGAGTDECYADEASSIIKNCEN